MEEHKSFPHFEDGDVAISVSPLQTYKLHSQVLKRNSTFFERELDHPGAKLNLKARNAGLATYYFELITPIQNDDGFGRLQQRELQDNGKPRNTHFASLPNPSHILNPTNPMNQRYWHSLLSTLYGLPPQFDTSNMATLVTDCSQLLNIAEQTGSLSRIREVVDLALMRQDTVLWQSIANAPLPWLQLAHRIQSPNIFQEACCHLVGTWNRVDKYAASELDEQVREVVQAKYDELEAAKRVVELRILGHYPSMLAREAKDRPGRPSYAADIYMWQAVGFYRQWFAQAISEKRTRDAEDGGAGFYRLMWEDGGRGYLVKEDFEAFHQWFPMSKKAAGVLEGHMAVLKEEVRVFVEDLVVDRTHVEGWKGYLCCAVVGEGEFPWQVGGGKPGGDSDGERDEESEEGGENSDSDSDSDVEMQIDVDVDEAEASIDPRLRSRSATPAVLTASASSKKATTAKAAKGKSTPKTKESAKSTTPTTISAKAKGKQRAKSNTPATVVITNDSNGKGKGKGKERAKSSTTANAIREVVKTPTPSPISDLGSPSNKGEGSSAGDGAVKSGSVDEGEADVDDGGEADDEDEDGDSE